MFLPGPAAFPPMADITWLKNVAIVCLEGQTRYKLPHAWQTRNIKF